MFKDQFLWRGDDQEFDMSSSFQGLRLSQEITSN